MKAQIFYKIESAGRGTLMIFGKLKLKVTMRLSPLKYGSNIGQPRSHCLDCKRKLGEIYLIDKI
jgi:hypothetical protein